MREPGNSRRPGRLTWHRVDLARNLAVGDFGDRDQKIVAVQKFTDCAVGVG